MQMNGLLKFKALGSFEAVWIFLVNTCVLWSLIVAVLAQASLFRSWIMLLAWFVAGWGGWLISRSMRFVSQKNENGMYFLFFTLILAVFLYARPVEHIPTLFDSGTYINTAAKLARNGSLSYQYTPFAELSAIEKKLFYVPSDRPWYDANSTSPWPSVSAVQGYLYNGSFFLLDSQNNTVYNTRPPVLTAWLASFEMLFGFRGMLYVVPLFALASLVQLYFLGLRLFDGGTGGLAVLFLVCSFPQLYFARLSYAEIPAQFFVLLMLYNLVQYWNCGHKAWLLSCELTVVATLATRLDTAIIALPVLLFCIVLPLLKSDWRASLVAFVGFIIATILILYTMNWPYFNFLAELLIGTRHLSLDSILKYVFVPFVVIACIAIFMVIILKYKVRKNNIYLTLQIIILLATIYGLYIRPLFPEYTVLNGMMQRSYAEEIMPVTARYISAVLIWLASFGLILTLRDSSKRMLPSIIGALFALVWVIFFWKYSITRTYPYALRRIIPDVLPSLSLFAAFSLRRIRNWPYGRLLSVLLIGLILVTLLKTAQRYWFYNEADNTWRFTEILADTFPEDAVIIFAPLEEGAMIGGFAAPLWTFFDQNTLLLNAGYDPEGLNALLCRFIRQERSVYLILSAPADSFGVNSLDLKSRLSWDSNLMAHSLNFPPQIWKFSLPAYIYQVKLEICDQLGVGN